MGWTVRIFDTICERIWWSHSKLLLCCYNQKCHTMKSKLTSHWPSLSGILGDNWVLRYLVASGWMIKITVNKISRICSTIRYEILQAGNQCSAGRRNEICCLPNAASSYSAKKKKEPHTAQFCSYSDVDFFFLEIPRFIKGKECGCLPIWPLPG